MNLIGPEVFLQLEAAPIFAIAALVITILVVLGIYASRIIKVTPGAAAIISGRRHRLPDGSVVGYRVLTGGRAFIFPVIERVDWIPLNVITADLVSPEIFTKNLVPVKVEAVAQIQIMSDDVGIGTAARAFLALIEGKRMQEAELSILQTVTKTLEGHIRMICSTLTVEETNSDREAFARKVQEVAETDLNKMGVHLASLVVKNITDERNYLVNLGRPKIAEIERSAVVAESEFNKDKVQKSAIYNMEAQTVKFDMDTKVAEANRDYNLKLQEYNAQIASQKAIADMSEPLKKQELSVGLAQKAAEANRQTVTIAAEAEAQAAIKRAEGNSEAIKKIGYAEAEAIKAKLLAEAEGMRAKAEAWKQYTEAAVLQMFFDKLPEVAEKIALPLENTQKIVVIAPDSSRGVPSITDSVVGIAAKLPAIVEAVTGVSIPDYIRSLRPAISGNQDSSPSPKTKIEEKTQTSG